MTASSYREIPLSRGYVAIVDPHDYDHLADRPWFALVSKGKVYAAYTRPKTKQTILMHRLLAGAPRYSPVHWKNGNTLDNRRSNLILASRKEAA